MKVGLFSVQQITTAWLHDADEVTFFKHYPLLYLLNGPLALHWNSNCFLIHVNTSCNICLQEKENFEVLNLIFRTTYWYLRLWLEIFHTTSWYNFEIMTWDISQNTTYNFDIMTWDISQNVQILFEIMT